MGKLTRPGESIIMVLVVKVKVMEQDIISYFYNFVIQPPAPAASSIVT